MAQIKSKNTKPEKTIRKILWSNNIRGYRIHYKLYGNPDIVFTKQGVAVFIDGCFWHKCPICFVKPRTRIKFWFNKIKGNVKRDKKVNITLKREGWKVLRFWEHDIQKNIENCVKKIARSIKSN